MTHQRQILTICKPNDKKAGRFAKRLFKYCNEHEIEIGQCQALDKEDLSSYTGLVVIGGDGTLNHIINNLPHFDLPMGIIPAGSGNDYVKSLNLGGNEAEIIETAVFGKPKSVDLGKCNDQLFLNGFGIGFDGQIAKEFEENRTILRGHAAYYYHVLRILATFKPKLLQFSIDGKTSEEEVILLTIAKGTTFGGGFKLTPHARINDGKFAICLIKNLSPIRRFLNVGTLKAGTHDRHPEVEFLEGKKIEIKNSEMIAHIDGEIVGSPPFELKVLGEKMKIRMRE